MYLTVRQQIQPVCSFAYPSQHSIGSKELVREFGVWTVYQRCLSIRLELQQHLFPNLKLDAMLSFQQMLSDKLSVESSFREGILDRFVVSGRKHGCSNHLRVISIQSLEWCTSQR
jgi:hypothetical protein